MTGVDSENMQEEGTVLLTAELTSGCSFRADFL